MRSVRRPKHTPLRNRQGRNIETSLLLIACTPDRHDKSNHHQSIMFSCDPVELLRGKSLYFLLQELMAGTSQRKVTTR
jgi:hypothetical protein